METYYIILSQKNSVHHVELELLKTMVWKLSHIISFFPKSDNINFFTGFSTAFRLKNFMVFENRPHRVYKCVEIFSLKNFANKGSIGAQCHLCNGQGRLTEIKRSGAVYKFIPGCGWGHVADDDIKVRSKRLEKIILHQKYVPGINLNMRRNIRGDRYKVDADHPPRAPGQFGRIKKPWPWCTSQIQNVVSLFYNGVFFLYFLKLKHRSGRESLLFCLPGIMILPLALFSCGSFHVGIQ